MQVYMIMCDLPYIPHCINAWSWNVHVHGIQTKQNPNDHQRNIIKQNKAKTKEQKLKDR